MKKIIKLTSVIALLISIFSINKSSISFANIDFENNQEYYQSLCKSVELSIADEAICDSYMQWLNKVIQDLTSNGKELAAQIAQNKQDIQRVISYIAVLSSQINQMEGQIVTLEGQIASLEQRIYETNESIKAQMFATQTTMNTNAYLSFIMSASSFSDMFRRVAGFEEITAHMKGKIEQMEADKRQIEENKAVIEAQKIALDEQREQLREQEMTYRREQVELEALQIANQQASEASKSMLKDVSAARTVVTSNGWRKPTDVGVKTAGTWFYPASFGGGIHLGLDIGLPIGSALYAPANGIVLDMFDNCANVGSLGNSCGGTMGNNLTVAVSVNNRSYILIFMHLQRGFSSILGWPSSNLITFIQGDLIARTASSGSSTGAHVHIEVIDMGTKDLASVAEDYGKNGDKSGGTGFGSRGYSNRCEVKGSTPCRQRPENFFGSFY